jgi:hypothetical protein
MIEVEMNYIEILFDNKGYAIAPEKIGKEIDMFPGHYKDATKAIIHSSEALDKQGDVFIKCASKILSSFGMTRSGAFHENRNETLDRCWKAIGTSLIEINSSVRKSGLSRDRYIVEISDTERDELIAEVWLITKKLLPFTTSKTAYGLVGASKILFSVLPEIVLPVDTAQWREVFQTVDIGDILRRMVSDIQKWEGITGKQLNDLGHSTGLTTLPSVYNVMAMHARPKT